jgi:DNA-binding transcriptional MerR regulator
VTKAAEAFRTISEVADALGVQAHVLRFWESKFPQVKPVKRAGGRRYYRPADVALLHGIRTLLHDQGITIRGVQKILHEQGARRVAELAASGTRGEAAAPAAPTPEPAPAAIHAAANVATPPQDAGEAPMLFDALPEQASAAVVALRPKPGAGAAMAAEPPRIATRLRALQHPPADREALARLQQRLHLLRARLASQAGA